MLKYHKEANDGLYIDKCDGLNIVLFIMGFNGLFQTAGVEIGLEQHQQWAALGVLQDNMIYPRKEQNHKNLGINGKTSNICALMMGYNGLFQTIGMQIGGPQKILKSIKDNMLQFDAYSLSLFLRKPFLRKLIITL